MATTIFRTAHSTVVRDAMDFSAALCDADGETIAQAVTDPAPPRLDPDGDGDAVRALRRSRSSRATSSSSTTPSTAGCTLPDIFIVKPVLRWRALLAFAVSDRAPRATWAGGCPGASACDNTEIFQEGLRLPWMQLYRAGEPVEDAVQDHPRQRAHAARDARRHRAQLAACHDRRARTASSSRRGTAPESFDAAHGRA